MEVRDVPRLSPRRREVLVRVHATSVTESDTYIREGGSRAPLVLRMVMRLMFGVRRPRRIPGIVFAGSG